MDALQRFMETYNRIDRDHLELLNDIYAADVVFIDPAHEMRGLDALRDYFAQLYANITAIDFSFDQSIVEGREAALVWTMTFRHPRLVGGQAVVVDGFTRLRFNEEGKAVYHRDYFDLGAMLYEHLPLIGRAIKVLKRRLGQ